MVIDARRWITAVAVFLLPIFLWGCASTGNHVASGHMKSAGAFPIPSEIQDNVDFWRNVFGVWSRHQVVFHDDEHLGVIYDVADLPGPVRAGYTAEQRAFVRSKEESLKYRLAAMERKIASGGSLTSDERALRDKIADAAGPQAIYGAHERVRTQRGVRERFRRGLEISGRYDQAFREIFRSEGVPEDLAYLPHVESSFQVGARSSAGAAGVWQFTSGTGRLYMTVNRAVDERLDPIVAADAAALYLRSAYAQLGSWPLAITSYNHGIGGMQRAKSLHGDDFGRIASAYDGPYFGFASRNFYAEFLAAREIAKHPQKYFPEGVHYEEPFSADRLVLKYSMPARHIAQYYGLSIYSLSEINLAWEPAVTRGRASIPAGTTVWLPEGSMQRVAGEPGPVPGKIASAEPIARPNSRLSDIEIAQTREPRRKSGAASVRLARAEAASTQKKTSKAKPPKVARLHIVKPNETLFHVASLYDLSVQELRRINRLGPRDNTIHPGQRLKVSI
jgi:membrane-bound lytic murein transglycosylase D